MENFEEFKCGALQFVFWGGFFKGVATAFGAMAIYQIYKYFKNSKIEENERKKQRERYMKEEDQNFK